MGNCKSSLSTKSNGESMKCKNCICQPKEVRKWTIFNGETTNPTISGPAIAYAENIHVVEESAYKSVVDENALWLKSQKNLLDAFDTRESKTLATRETIINKLNEIEAMITNESLTSVQAAEAISALKYLVIMELK